MDYIWTDNIYINFYFIIVYRFSSLYVIYCFHGIICPVSRCGAVSHLMTLLEGWMLSLWTVTILMTTQPYTCSQQMGLKYPMSTEGNCSDTRGAFSGPDSDIDREVCERWQIWQDKYSCSMTLLEGETRPLFTLTGRKRLLQKLMFYGMCLSISFS